MRAPSVATRTGLRLLGAEEAPLLARPFYASGHPGPIAAALAHVPEVMEVALPLFGAVLGPSSVDERTKEIIVLRTSAQAGCRYCVEAHSVVALDSGLTIEEVRALRGEVGVPETFTTATDLELVAWCDAIACPGAIDPATRAEFFAGRADHEVVALTILATTTLLLNRFCTALELPTSPETLRRLKEVGLP